LTAGIDDGKVIPLTMLDTAGRRLEAARAAVIEEEQSRRVPVTADEARAAFESADLDGKRALVRQFTNGVVVERGGAYDVAFPALVLGDVAGTASS
jgi:hypothetical protein